MSGGKKPDHASSEGEASSAGPTPATRSWVFWFEDHPADFDMIGEAWSKLPLAPTPQSEDAAKRYLKEGIARQLLASGLRRDQIVAIQEPLDERIDAIQGQMQLISQTRGQLDSEVAKFVKEAPRFYADFLEYQRERDPHLVGYLEEHLDEILDHYDKFDVQSASLRETLKDTIARYLRDTGLGEAEAAKIARVTVRHFQAAVGPHVALFHRREAAELAGQLASAMHKATRETPTESWRKQAGFDPHLEAPAIWNRKEDRLPGETPIAFLKRVWQPWLDAGVLFQDDIKRAGDKTLVRAVRGYCKRNDLKPADHLPPPMRVRVDRALAAAIPGSAEAEVLKSRIRSRRSKARKRQLEP